MQCGIETRSHHNRRLGFTGTLKRLLALCLSSSLWEASREVRVLGKVLSPSPCTISG